MGCDLDQYYRYHHYKGHNTDDYKVLKWDIDDLIHKGI